MQSDIKGYQRLMFDVCFKYLKFSLHCLQMIFFWVMVKILHTRTLNIAFGLMLTYKKCLPKLAQIVSVELPRLSSDKREISEVQNSS
jgi:hypothetical protein